MVLFRLEIILLRFSVKRLGLDLIKPSTSTYKKLKTLRNTEKGKQFFFNNKSYSLFANEY